MSYSARQASKASAAVHLATAGMGASMGHAGAAHYGLSK